MSNRSWSDRWNDYVVHFNVAVQHYEVGEDWLSQEQYSLAARRAILCWYELFKAEEALYKAPSTPRQQEAQKLWQQRGLLERTYKNLQAVEKIVAKDGDFTDGLDREKINKAIDTVYWLIQDNKNSFKTISRRLAP